VSEWPTPLFLGAPKGFQLRLAIPNGILAVVGAGRLERRKYETKFTNMKTRNQNEATTGVAALPSLLCGMKQTELFAACKPLRSRLAASIFACLVAASSSAQTARELRGAVAVEPLANEPPARIVIDPPLAEPLSRGRVVVQYRAENLHIVPVFGATALAVSPRVGHAHVTVDDGPWGWADASGEPVILNGLPPGPHKILIELVNSNHKVIDQGTVQFIVPEAAAGDAQAAKETHSTVAVQPVREEPPAKIIIDSPLAEPLSRGVVFIRYRTQNLQIVPVFGPAALAVSPRIGHIHVTVDDATWHWADASGIPVIIQRLPPGPHKILIELVNANHQVMDQGTVQVTVPASNH
jgi:hypothetical protein